MQARRALEQDLRKALLAGELELHDRLVINIASDKTSRLERWCVGVIPRREWHLQDLSVPSEEIGLIVPIAEWVITAGVCRVGIGAAQGSGTLRWMAPNVALKRSRNGSGHGAESAKRRPSARAIRDTRRDNAGLARAPPCAPG
jgi:EAL domain-containing protein (putative c-di-GMP-specific phosphodiesterase class I)